MERMSSAQGDIDEKNIGSKMQTEKAERDASSSENDNASFNGVPGEHTKLKRQLKNRHIAMIRYVFQSMQGVLC